MRVLRWALSLLEHESYYSLRQQNDDQTNDCVDDGVLGAANVAGITAGGNIPEPPYYYHNHGNNTYYDREEVDNVSYHIGKLAAGVAGLSAGGLNALTYFGLSIRERNCRHKVYYQQQSDCNKECG